MSETYFDLPVGAMCQWFQDVDSAPVAATVTGTNGKGVLEMTTCARQMMPSFKMAVRHRRDPFVAERPSVHKRPGNGLWDFVPPYSSEPIKVPAPPERPLQVPGSAAPTELPEEVQLQIMALDEQRKKPSEIAKTLDIPVKLVTEFLNKK